MKIKVINADIFSWYIDRRGEIFDVVVEFGKIYLKDDIDKNEPNPREFDPDHIEYIKN